MQEQIKIENIMTGDCMLLSSKSWLGRQIQKFQNIQNKDGGMYNHAGMFWWCYDELMVIEADKRGITITPFLKCFKEENYNSIIALRPKFPVDGSEYGKFMLPYAGKTRYDKFNLLFAQSIKILTFGKVWIGEKEQNQKKFICGEWVAFVYNYFNKHNLIFTKPEAKIAPVDIYLSDKFIHFKIY